MKRIFVIISLLAISSAMAKHPVTIVDINCKSSLGSTVMIIGREAGSILIKGIVVNDNILQTEAKNRKDYVNNENIAIFEIKENCNNIKTINVFTNRSNYKFEVRNNKLIERY